MDGDDSLETPPANSSATHYSSELDGEKLWYLCLICPTACCDPAEASAHRRTHGTRGRQLVLSEKLVLPYFRLRHGNPPIPTGNISLNSAHQELMSTLNSFHGLTESIDLSELPGPSSNTPMSGQPAPDVLNPASYQVNSQPYINCGVVSSTVTTLYDSNISHHHRKPEDEDSSTRCKFNCSMCEEKYCRLRDLIVHRESVHPIALRLARNANPPTRATQNTEKNWGYGQFSSSPSFQSSNNIEEFIDVESIEEELENKEKGDEGEPITEIQNLILPEQSEQGSSTASSRSRIAKDRQCNHCGTKKSTLWRRNNGKTLLCNPCGLHFAKYMSKRPTTLVSSEIKRRKGTKVGFSGIIQAKPQPPQQQRLQKSALSNAGRPSLLTCPDCASQFVKESSLTVHIARCHAQPPHPITTTTDKDENTVKKFCSHCGTLNASAWKWDRNTHRPLCNVCFSYLIINGRERPLNSNVTSHPPPELERPGGSKHK